MSTNRSLMASIWCPYMARPLRSFWACFQDGRFSDTLHTKSLVWYLYRICNKEYHTVVLTHFKHCFYCLTRLGIAFKQSHCKQTLLLLILSKVSWILLALYKNCPKGFIVEFLQRAVPIGRPLKFAILTSFYSHSISWSEVLAPLLLPK